MSGRYSKSQKKVFLYVGDKEGHCKIFDTRYKKFVQVFNLFPNSKPRSRLINQLIFVKRDLTMPYVAAIRHQKKKIAIVNEGNQGQEVSHFKFGQPVVAGFLYQNQEKHNKLDYLSIVTKDPTTNQMTLTISNFLFLTLS